MSVVSGIVLICSVCEETVGPTVVLFERLNDWLEERGENRPLALVEEGFGGGKHPQLFCAGAGINYCPEDEFAAFAMSLPWERPENVILAIQPEDGSTRVYRPRLHSQVVTAAAPIAKPLPVIGSSELEAFVEGRKL